MRYADKSTNPESMHTQEMVLIIVQHKYVQIWSLLQGAELISTRGHCHSTSTSGHSTKVASAIQSHRKPLPTQRGSYLNRPPALMSQTL